MGQVLPPLALGLHLSKLLGLHNTMNIEKLSEMLFEAASHPFDPFLLSMNFGALLADGAP